MSSIDINYFFLLRADRNPEFVVGDVKSTFDDNRVSNISKYKYIFHTVNMNYRMSTFCIHAA
jgi:hypothetical protein